MSEESGVCDGEWIREERVARKDEYLGVEFTHLLFFLVFFPFKCPSPGTGGKRDNTSLLRK